MPFSYIKIILFSSKNLFSRLIVILKSRLIETFRTWLGFGIDFLLSLNHVTLVLWIVFTFHLFKTCKRDFPAFFVFFVVSRLANVVKRIFLVKIDHFQVFKLSKELLKSFNKVWKLN